MRKIHSVICALAIIAVCLSLASCAGRQPRNYAEQQYYARLRAQPTAFVMPTSQAEQAWARAHAFITRYSSMKIQTSSQYVLQTYNPVGDWPRWGYTVNRMPGGADMVQFEVWCMCCNPFNKADTIQNAKALALYMQTGELMPYFVRH